MHHHEQYHFWGMHAGWWLFAIVIILIVGWAGKENECIAGKYQYLSFRK